MQNVVLLLLSTLILSLLNSVFVYTGWNWGVANALSPHLHQIDYKTAFWLSLFFSTVGSTFRSALAVQSKNDESEKQA